MFEIGNSLREARLRQGLDYVDVERVTKIRPKYLRALEDEEFETLPAQTYVKGFLRTYAEQLGLDGQLYVDEYNSRYVAREDEVPFRPRRSTSGARHGRTESNVVLGALVGIAVVFALVIAAWKSGGDSPTQRPTFAPSPIRPAAQPDLVVNALRGSTRMEVRNGSSEGKPRFSGTVEHGRQKRFALKGRLWVYVSRPASVDFVISGRPTRIPARIVYVTAAGVTRAPAR